MTGPNHDKSKDRRAEREAWRQAKREQQARRRKRFFIFIVFMVLILFVALSGVHLIRSVAVPVDASNTETVEVTIPEGASVANIGKILEDEGVIRSVGTFKMYVRTQGVESKFKAGHHKVSPSMSMDEIIKELTATKAGSANAKKILVPEGYNVEQIAEVVAKNTRYSQEDFMALMKDEAFQEEMVKAYPDLLQAQYDKGQVRYIFEGYLFPATYEFDDSQSLKTLVRMMLDKTTKSLEDKRGDIEKSKYSLNEIMTMASLVEKEGIHAEDRGLIAGTFYNRLKINMPLQSDITILYAINEHKEMVYHGELDVDSPYNLYKNTGLGPGPFNNPGMESIEAALNPAETDALYFFANLKTGDVYFTKDFQEHLDWQKQYEKTGKVNA